MNHLHKIISLRKKTEIICAAICFMLAAGGCGQSAAQSSSPETEAPASKQETEMPSSQQETEVSGPKQETEMSGPKQETEASALSQESETSNPDDEDDESEASDSTEKVETSTAVQESGSTVELIKNRGVLRVGATGDYKPMSFLDPETGVYWGFDVELANDLAEALDVEIEFVPTSWPTLMQDTLAGEFDLAICGITITDARKEQALMSDGYLGNGKTVLCRQEDADKYTSIEAINRSDVKVMENPGGLNEKFAIENLPDATLIIHDVNEEIPGLIAEGEADVMITEIMEAGYYVGQDSRLAAPLIYEPFTHGQLGVLMPKGSEDLLEFVNQFLVEEKATGRIDEIAEEYIYQYIEDADEMDNAA